MQWSDKKLRELQARGLKVIDSKSNKIGSNRIARRKVSKRSKEKDWLFWQLHAWCKDNNLILETEVRFDKVRRWRFDYAIRSLMVAIEYEGLMSEKSVHTTVLGFTDNTEKYNEAQLQGWKVLRYTVLNYKNVLTALNRLL